MSEKIDKKYIGNMQGTSNKYKQEGTIFGQKQQQSISKAEQEYRQGISKVEIK